MYIHIYKSKQKVISSMKMLGSRGYMIPYPICKATHWQLVCSLRNGRKKGTHLSPHNKRPRI